MNGCAFCLDMHVRDLRNHGESWQRINSISVWRETNVFSSRERAALRWAEELTRIVDQHGDHDTAFETLQEYFDDQEIVDLSWAVATINAWNRMAVGMRQPQSERPID